MIKHFCDICGKEMDESKSYVMEIARAADILNGEKKELCEDCGERLTTGKWLETWLPKPEQKEDFWATNDPSGGSLPGPESEMDEEYEARMKAAEEAKRQQASKEKPKRQLVVYGKVWALRNAGWKARQIAEEMKISEATVWNVCKKMRAMKEMEGDKEGES